MEANFRFLVEEQDKMEGRKRGSREREFKIRVFRVWMGFYFGFI
jgi:hypothetical protein